MAEARRTIPSPLPLTSGWGSETGTVSDVVSSIIEVSERSDVFSPVISDVSADPVISETVSEVFSGVVSGGSVFSAVVISGVVCADSERSMLIGGMSLSGVLSSFSPSEEQAAKARHIIEAAKTDAKNLFVFFILYRSFRFAAQVFFFAYSCG